MQLFRKLNEQGTTIVQVTHSETNAAFGSRTLELRDGWLTRDTSNPHPEHSPWNHCLDYELKLTFRLCFYTASADSARKPPRPECSHDPELCSNTRHRPPHSPHCGSTFRIPGIPSRHTGPAKSLSRTSRTRRASILWSMMAFFSCRCRTPSTLPSKTTWTLRSPATTSLSRALTSCVRKPAASFAASTPASSRTHPRGRRGIRFGSHGCRGGRHNRRRGRRRNRSLRPRPIDAWHRDCGRILRPDHHRRREPRTLYRAALQPHPIQRSGPAHQYHHRQLRLYPGLRHRDDLHGNAR